MPAVHVGSLSRVYWAQLPPHPLNTGKTLADAPPREPHDTPRGPGQSLSRPQPDEHASRDPILADNVVMATQATQFALDEIGVDGIHSFF